MLGARNSVPSSQESSVDGSKDNEVISEAGEELELLAGILVKNILERQRVEVE